jgi:hypothetical protein
MRQQILADGSFERFRKKTRKELFLCDMEQIIFGEALINSMNPCRVRRAHRKEHASC